MNTTFLSCLGLFILATLAACGDSQSDADLCEQMRGRVATANCETDQMNNGVSCSMLLHGDCGDAARELFECAVEAESVCTSDGQVGFLGCVPQVQALDECLSDQGSTLGVDGGVCEPVDGGTLCTFVDASVPRD